MKFTNFKNDRRLFCCLLKYIAFIASLTLLFLVYTQAPYYSTSFYAPLWPIVPSIVFVFILLGFPYFLWANKRLEISKDGYYHMGQFLLGHWRSVDWKELQQYVLSWILRGFFIPFLLAGGVEHYSRLLRYGINFQSFDALYFTLLNLIYCVDLTFGTLGYICVFRAFGTHIRSVNTSPLAWVVMIICYPPISNWIWTDQYLRYRGKITWMEIFHDYPFLYITWGFAILLLMVVYAWATASFGFRFSNLTNRGTITRGPYAFMRHPAYVCKNLAWWMIYIPFATHSTWQQNLRATICLLITNGIYYLRAKTEEWHLKRDPEYLTYWQRMETESLWERLKMAACKQFKPATASSQTATSIPDTDTSKPTP